MQSISPMTNRNKFETLLKLLIDIENLEMARDFFLREAKIKKLNKLEHIRKARSKQTCINILEYKLNKFLKETNE